MQSDSEDDDQTMERDSRGRRHMKLPGVRSGDRSERSARPEVRVAQVHFSATGNFISYFVYSYLSLVTFKAPLGRRQQQKVY